MASTSLKRASLEEAYEAAVAAQRTLRAELRKRESAVLKLANGPALKSVSANGRSTVYQDGTSHTVEVDLWRELIDLHDLVAATLLEETGAAPTDEAVKNRMLETELVPIREERGDFTYLRTA